jgi:hypothetical protein
VLAKQQSGPHALVTDEDQTFWANNGDGYVKKTGAIWRVPLPGGAPVAEIAARVVGAFAANAGHLAWIESSVNAGVFSISVRIRAR